MNDKQSDADFRTFLRKAFTAADEVMRDGAVFYIWHAGRESYHFIGALRDVGWGLHQILIWEKDQMILGRNDYQFKHEPCLYGWKDGAAHLWTSDRKQVSVMHFNRAVANKEHPTMKPVELIAYEIGNSTHKGDIVLDTFGGSGTTMIACEQLDRVCYMAELDPHYCDVIINRWENLTGEKAVKINV